MDIETNLKFKTSGKSFLSDCRYEYAIDDFKKYLESKPDDLGVLLLLGDAYSSLGQKREALGVYEKVMKIDPTHTSTLLNMGKIVLSGPNYLHALKSSHVNCNSKRYIEIGVCKGVSFSLADEQTIAVGIDPEPQLDVDSLPKKHIVVSDTSDNFFESGRLEKYFDGRPFDMAFLDGMHLFEFALRDFINLEKHSNSKSIVFVHDLYPMNAETATRERNSDFWSGDVWKLVLCLQEYRPDLGLEVLPCPPTGLGYITNLDSSSTILTDNYDEILEKYIDMPFEVIENDREKKLLLAGVDHPMLVSA